LLRRALSKYTLEILQPSILPSKLRLPVKNPETQSSVYHQFFFKKKSKKEEKTQRKEKGNKPKSVF
jgi:hypothetical protein